MAKWQSRARWPACEQPGDMTGCNGAVGDEMGIAFRVRFCGVR